MAWLPTDLPDAEHAPVTVSMLAEPLIHIPGGTDAPRVTVRGVAFECTRGAAIAGEGVHDTQVTDCTFRNVGGAAIELSGTGIAVERCTFEDIGGTGVAMRGGDRTTLTPSHDRVADCTFTRCGRLQRTYHPAIDIDGVGIEVLRNELSDLPHIALLYAGNEHRIEANHIHHVAQETGDAGAMYIGRDWTSHGNVLRGNLVHHVAGTDARYQNAFYVDDMSSGIVLEHNLVVRCNWGMLIGGGRDMVIRNNAFVACGKAIMFDARGVGWMAPNIADPKRSTLHQRLAAIPVDQEPWRTRYPTLQHYLTDRFGRPVNGTVAGNALIATAPGKIDDRECVTESGTVTLPVPAGTTIEAECERLIRAACTGQVQVGNATQESALRRRPEPTCSLSSPCLTRMASTTDFCAALRPERVTF
ncbi:MAG: right-handed parallel beta-helix repeat-containing protein [Proteobacteria bacterium]|nr:right-handed parallel beta-helix repeat-containing protein [Pseudomonadota bacterium]